MDNTVGSLTQEQKSIIIGSILGDGYLRIIKGRKNAFLEINHSIKQWQYVEWKYQKLKNLVGGLPKSRRGKGERIAYRFYTKQHPELTKLLHQFYQNGKKIFPEKLMLDPIILAVWYMDDGSKCRISDVYLNTQQFDNESQERIINALSKSKLLARLNKDKSYFRIRFLKSSLPKLKNLIKRYIIPSMRYKIEL
ncbi:MAG: LAGLIDADG endonuclease [bacterium]|nr:LAGLIDADG endonuclease [bacterium]